MPQRKSRRLFRFGVPHSSDEHERGAHGCFKESEEHSRDEHARGRTYKRGAYCRDAPAGDAESDPFRWGKPLDKIAYLVVSMWMSEVSESLLFGACMRRCATA